MLKNNVFNGMTEDGKLTNAHLSYKGLSVIIDYEWRLHSYSFVPEEHKGDIVPVEVYPYKDDAEWFFVKLDDEFKKADMQEIISTIDNLE